MTNHRLFAICILLLLVGCQPAPSEIAATLMPTQVSGDAVTTTPQEQADQMISTPTPTDASERPTYNPTINQSAIEGEPTFTPVPAQAAADPTTQASDPNRPPEALPVLTDELVIIAENNLWTWSPDTGEVQQLTSQGFYGLPSRSPDGEWIAFCYSPYTFLDDTAEACTLWLWNVEAGYVTLLADLPNGESWDGFYTRDHWGYGRSTPTWSPDSSKIAWTEFVGAPEYMDSSYTLEMFDFETRTRSSIASLDMGWQDAGIRLGGAKWGAGGIAHTVSSYDYGGSPCGWPAARLCVYQPDGATNCKTTSDSYLTSSYWLNIYPQLAVQHLSGRWDTYDPAKQTFTSTDHHLALYSLMNPQTSLSMVWESVSSTHEEEFCSMPESQVWIASPTGDRIAEVYPNYYWWGAAISSDGQQFAYLGESGLTVWHDDEEYTIPIEYVQWLVWGPRGWWLSPLK